MGLPSRMMYGVCSNVCMVSTQAATVGITQKSAGQWGPGEAGRANPPLSGHTFDYRKIES